MTKFKQYQAQTSSYPLGMQVSHAQGSYIYDTQGKAYLDLVAGVSALPLGHGYPGVVKAIQDQANQYLHVMVYGEYAQQPAIDLCEKLAQLLPDPLEMTYLVNSGTEAVEAAMKLARRVTGRSQLIAMQNAYHGNTMGALSLMTYEARKAPFRPLIPGIKHIAFNNEGDLQQIDQHTAGVIVESIQGGAGFIIPSNSWMKALRKRCDAMGCLLILDEIQPGMGRTGSMFYFEQHGIVPDVVITGKGLGGGMPIGAMTASAEHMLQLSHDPALGHITTFGGNALIAAAALATIQGIENSNLMQDVESKEVRFRESLQHPLIKEIRGRGLMLAAILTDPNLTAPVVTRCHENGLILFFLLYETRALRITPPLNISMEEIDTACGILIEVLNEFL